MREQEKRELVEAVLKVLESKGLLKDCGCAEPPQGGRGSWGDKSSPLPRREVKTTVGTAGKIFAEGWTRKPVPAEASAPGAGIAPGTTGKVHDLPVAASAELDHTDSPDCPHCATVGRLKELGADRVAVCHPTKACTAVAGSIDHTMLKPNATQEEVAKLCQEARSYCFASVCVNPAYVHLAAKLLTGSGVKVCTVVGFPLGSTTPTVKAIEARDAIANGADEIDMVLNIGALKSGNDALALGDIRAVREATRGRVLKVILETALLNDEEKVRACALAKKAGADFVKTSTGFGGGGATVEDIRLMRGAVGPLMGVKASGGIRDAATAAAMLSAGATRLGTSASIAIVSPKAEAAEASQGGKY